MWIQKNNPATDSSLYGFEPITLAFNSRVNFNGWKGVWKGLGKNVVAGGSALIDDFPQDQPTWFSAIGAFTFWDDTETIPGPVLDTDNLELSRVMKVELYVRKYQDSCETGWSYFGGKCYKLYEEAKAWDAARVVCQTDAPTDSAGDLASVTSNDIQLFMASLFQSSNIVLIGGKRVAGQFEWSDGSLWDYDNWGTGQPESLTDDSLTDHYCMGIRQDWEYTWDDLPDEPFDGYICQYNP